MLARWKINDSQPLRNVQTRNQMRLERIWSNHKFRLTMQLHLPKSERLNPCGLGMGDTFCMLGMYIVSFAMCIEYKLT